MSNSLLDSLRAIVHSKPKEAAPFAAPPVHSATATDFRSLPDYAGYQAMQNGLKRLPALASLYFLPRQSYQEAEIETPHGRLLSFSGYNYLGLSNDPRVIDRACDALRRYGTHAGAARMVGGEIEAHHQFERALADFIGQEDAVIGVSGYSTNVSTISYLLGPKDLLVHDSFMHNSGIVGGIQSGARRVPFPHNDLDRLEQILAEHRGRAERAMILVEGAYSMNGDIVDLPRLLQIKEKYACWLMADEAHSIGALGATGRGLAEHWQVEPKRIDITMGTLSKSLASCGGFIAGSETLISLLRFNAPGMLLYSTGINPASTAAAHAALEIMIAEPQRILRLQENARTFCRCARERGLDIGTADGLTPIVPVMVGDDIKALRVAVKLFEQGVLVHPIMYPAVERNAARFRFFITAMHTEAQIARTLDILSENLR